MSQVVVIKVKTGTPPPIGYTFVRTIRGLDIYNKIIPKITTTEVDELSNYFNTMNMNMNDNIAIISQTDEDAFLSALEKMTIGGRRKSRRKMTKKKSIKRRKSRKSRKH